MVHPKGAGLAGTSTKTKVIGLRVPVVIAEDWEAKAKARGITVTAYVLERAMRGGGQSSRPASTEPIDQSAHHQSGPVMASATPTAVSGEARPFFKPGQRAAIDVLERTSAKGKDKR